MKVFGNRIFECRADVSQMANNQHLPKPAPGKAGRVNTSNAWTLPPTSPRQCTRRPKPPVRNFSQKKRSVDKADRYLVIAHGTPDEVTKAGYLMEQEKASETTVIRAEDPGYQRCLARRRTFAWCVPSWTT